MKTIEERANDYAETRCIDVESELHKRFFIDAFSSSYIQGANEQQKIDIDKACEWLKIAIQCGVHPCSSNSFVEDFRKAMLK